MITTILIFFPIVAGIAMLFIPARSMRIFGISAIAVAIIELGLWLGLLAKFDFGRAGLQQGMEVTWFDDLGVAFKVGLYDFSTWLVGLTIIVMLSAMVYALWDGRKRARAYFSLLLILLGSTIGVFVSQDLLLFYVFFEAMLIPLYILVGVWGGAQRQIATIKLLLYTLAGSLLMLIAIVAFGLQQGTFDLTKMGSNQSTWIFLGFMIAFAIKAPLWPFHGWLPDAYRQAPPEISALLSGVISKTATFGVLRIVLPSFPEPVAEFQNTILALAAIGLLYSSLLAFRQPDFRGVIAYSSIGQMCLIFIGLFALTDSGIGGGMFQMINHGLVSAALFLLAGVIENRTGTNEFRFLGGMARGRPLLATTLLLAGVIALAVPGSSVFAGEFLILNGVFPIGWGWAVAGTIGIIIAALYMLRAISATLHGDIGSAVPAKARDLRLCEIGAIIPLIAILIVLSVWPAAITGNQFTGKPVDAITKRFEP